jgi:ribonuclease D
MRQSEGRRVPGDARTIQPLSRPVVERWLAGKSLRRGAWWQGRADNAMVQPLHPLHVRADATFLEILKRLEGHPELCIDCEFQTEGRYFPRLCLVQLAFGSEVWAVDPHRVSLAALAPALESEGIRKVVHDGRQDLPILAKATGTTSIRNVLDTQVAAAFVGYGGSIGYGALVQAVCGVRLDKSLQVSDWTRELSDAQLEYALDDVRHLSAVSAALQENLAARGRLDWAFQACAEAALRALTRPEPDKLYRRVASVSRLNPEQLGILREVAKWRDHVARTTDKPAPSVASDLALKAIALHPPRDLRALESVRGLGAGRNQPWARKLLEAVASGSERPEPKFRPLLSSEEEARIDGMVSLLRLTRHFVAVREGIAADVLADQSELRELVEAHLKAEPVDADNGVLLGWRREVLGELALQVLAGRVAFRVDSTAPAGVTLTS